MARLIFLGVLSLLFSRNNNSASAIDASDEQHVTVSGECAVILQLVEDLQKRLENVETENKQQSEEIAALKKLIQDRDNGESRPHTAPEPIADDSKRDNTVDADTVNDRHPRKLQRAEQDMTVAFYASLNQSIYHLGQFQNVRFEHVITNIGNAYDSYTGVFIAPVEGVYVFSVTVMTSGHLTTHFGFALNGHMFTRLFINGLENAYDSSSQTIVLRLRQGDDVSIQHLDYDKGLEAGDYSTFVGFLLQQTEGQLSAIIG